VQDPTGLFTTRPDPAEVAALGLVRPVLVEALDGFVDAGNGRRLAREHLLESLESQLLVSFDVDQLLDYRARRPEMTFSSDHWADYAEPRLEIRLVRDLNQVPFLLLSGPEPDVQWERFIAAIALLVAELDVRLVVGLTAIPMAVPHTRPLTAIAHGRPEELVADYPKWLSTVQVPGSVGNLLEYRLNQNGTAACGFAAAVPYYLANVDYPDAAHTLLTSLAGVGDLALPTEAVVRAAEVVRGQVDRQIAENDDVVEVVQRLEQQYDDLSTTRGGSLLTDGARLPTADELGAEFEQYLSNRPDDETSD
jgi:predicted ATP-grasp superfamily ATP-dependent carboligase